MAPSSDAQDILDRIESGLVAHGGDLGGWTRREGTHLQVFDGRVTLRAEMAEAPRESAREHGVRVHAHVTATLHDHGDEELEACVFGHGASNEAAVQVAAGIWVASVAGVIRSFLDGREACSVVRADGAFGLADHAAWVGPAMMRGPVPVDARTEAALGAELPWFRFAPECAAPRRLHLAKVCVSFDPASGWRRMIEVDGHEAFHSDGAWPTDARPNAACYATRFAVFGLDDRAVDERATLDRTIEEFARRVGQDPEGDVDRAVAAMVAAGHAPRLVYDCMEFATLAFSRTTFGHLGIEVADTIVRARRDGTVEAGVPLASIPAFTRAMALAPGILASMDEDARRRISLYHAESHLIVQFLEGGRPVEELAGAKLLPCVVPDPGVDDATMERALALARGATAPAPTAPARRPWWKFW